MSSVCIPDVSTAKSIIDHYEKEISKLETNEKFNSNISYQQYLYELGYAVAFPWNGSVQESPSVLEAVPRTSSLLQLVYLLDVAVEVQDGDRSGLKVRAVQERN